MFELIIAQEVTPVTYEELKVKHYNPYCQNIFLRHPRYDLSAKLRSLSEQPFNFTIHNKQYLRGENGVSGLRRVI